MTRLSAWGNERSGVVFSSSLPLPLRLRLPLPLPSLQVRLHVFLHIKLHNSASYSRLGPLPAVVGRGRDGWLVVGTPAVEALLTGWAYLSYPKRSGRLALSCRTHGRRLLCDVSLTLLDTRRSRGSAVHCGAPGQGGGE